MPAAARSVNVVFDAALGHRAADPLALALVLVLESRGEAQLIALNISTANLQAAAMALTIRNFYRPSAGLREAPVGLLASAKLNEKTTMTSIPLAKRDAEGRPVYSHSISKLTDTADSIALVRNALASQSDESAVVVLTGPATTLARYLEMPGSKDLVARKVSQLVIAWGEFPESSADFAMTADPDSAKRVLSEWPTPIFVVGRDVSEEVKFPASSIDKDFSWASNHPVADAYRAFHTMPYDAPTGSLAAALFALKPEEEYFIPSDPGRFEVLADGRTTFIASPTGRHRYLSLAPEKKGALAGRYVELASSRSAVPASRGGRGRGAPGAAAGPAGRGQQQAPISPAQ